VLVLIFPLIVWWWQPKAISSDYFEITEARFQCKITISSNDSCIIQLLLSLITQQGRPLDIGGGRIGDCLQGFWTKCFAWAIRNFFKEIHLDNCHIIRIIIALFVLSKSSRNVICGMIIRLILLVTSMSMIFLWIAASRSTMWMIIQTTYNTGYVLAPFALHGTSAVCLASRFVRNSVLVLCRPRKECLHLDEFLI
jgi:hypothetical protein